MIKTMAWKSYWQCIRDSKGVVFLNMRYAQLPEKETKQAQTYDVILLIAMVLMFAFTLDLGIFVNHPGATIVSLIVTSLYIYIYESIEQRGFGSSIFQHVYIKNPCYDRILLNRLVFFCVFIFFHLAFLSQWDLYTKESPDILTSFFAFQMTYVVVLLGLINTGNRMQIRSRTKRIFYSISLILWFGSCLALGEEFASNKFLQQMSSAIITAVIVSAGTKFYLWVTGYSLADGPQSSSLKNRR